MTARKIADLLLLVTVFSFPMEEVVKLPGLGTISRLLGLAVFAAWTAATFTTRRTRPPVSFHATFLALVVWVGFSLFWSLDPTASGARLLTYMQLFVLTLIVWDFCDSEKSILNVMQALIVGLWLNAANSYWNFARGIEAEYERFSSSGSDANEAALLLAIGIPFALYLALHSSTRWIGVFNMSYVPVAVVAIALSGSRTVIVAGLAVVVYIVSIVRNMRPTAMIALLVLLIGGFAAISVVVPSSAVERSASVGTAVSEGELNGRAQIWSESVESFVERPLHGAGAGATREALPTGKVAHNVVLTMAVELGLVGVILFALLGVTLIRAVWSMETDARNLWLAVLCTWAIGSLTLAIETRKYTWLVLGLAVAASSVAVSQERISRPRVATHLSNQHRPTQRSPKPRVSNTREEQAVPSLFREIWPDSPNGPNRSLRARPSVQRSTTRRRM